MKYKLLFLIFFCCVSCLIFGKNRVQVGAYYFDGWSGLSPDRNPKWATNAPTHLTYKLKTEFTNREPIWGWRDDDVRIMEKQIDLASQNGIDFFAFCWYWYNDGKSINKTAIENSPLNTSIQLFLKAKNRNKMKFCVLIANHQGHEIVGQGNWLSAIQYMKSKYFKSNSYLKVDNKPVIVVFDPWPLHNGKTTMIKADSLMMEAGFNGLYYIACGPNQNLFKYNLFTWYNTFPAQKFTTNRVPYKVLVDAAEEAWYKQPKLLPVAPIVMTGWDVRPWRSDSDKSIYYIDKTPLQFKRHLEDAYDFILNRKTKEKFIFIYAWNELGEGGWLVPTKGDPSGEYLRQVKNVVKEYRK
jgi:hypothetical protein